MHVYAIYKSNRQTFPRPASAGAVCMRSKSGCSKATMSCHAHTHVLHWQAVHCVVDSINRLTHHLQMCRDRPRLSMSSQSQIVSVSKCRKERSCILSVRPCCCKEPKSQFKCSGCASGCHSTTQQHMLGLLGKLSRVGGSAFIILLAQTQCANSSRWQVASSSQQLLQQ